MDQHIYDDAGESESVDDRQTRDEPDTTNHAEQNQHHGASQPPPLTSREKHLLDTQWQQRLAGAAQQAAQAGKLDGAVARMISRLQRPSVPWRSLLARYLCSTARANYDPLRPSQRREGDAILPSLRAQQINLVVALDTSGSVKEEELNAFITEVNAIKGAVNARVTVLACDAVLDSAAPWVFETWEPLTLPAVMKGGGSTDFNPVFDWVQSHGLPPDMLIYFTDARGRFPERPPAFETLWLVKGKTQVPWGKRVQLN
jgi:predicted metal-dependent peptidase